MDRRTRITYGLIWAIAALLTGALVINYFSYVTEHINEDSSIHLSEVYTQVDRNFNTFIDQSWINLGEWNETISSETPEQARESIASRKEAWGFTEFLFLNDSDAYMTINGETGSLKHEEDHVLLHDEHENVMDSQTLSDGSSVTLLAIPVSPSTFQGFAYDAVAITFTNEDMAQAINTDAFEGESTCFILKPDGSIVLTTQEGSTVFANYLTFLSTASSLDEAQIEELRQDWKQGSEGVVLCHVGDENYYLSYEPTGYRDYILLGVVPESAVSGNLQRIQEVTIDAAIKIALIIFAAAILVIILRNRKQARFSAQQIKNRDQMFSMIADNVDDISLMVDHDTGKVDYVSPNIKRLMNIPAEDILGNEFSFDEYVPHEKSTLSRSLIENLTRGESITDDLQMRNPKTGELHWYHVTIHRDDAPTGGKFFVVLSDRTEERRMNERLQEALDTAKNANQAKSNFLSNMSHDIRTPMNAILGFTELMDVHADDPEKVHNYVDKITASGEHLLGLINDVLDMSKIESGSTSLSNERFDLDRLVDDIRDIMAPQAKAKSQTFDVELVDIEHEHLVGDKLRINQILLNLLSNAVKYTPEGGTVTFKASEVPNKSPHLASIQFDVIDTGFGMSPEYLEVIFEPFTREENSTTNKIQGTGLGMAITKNLIDLMGGIISVESEQGKGSRFAVTLTFEIADESQGAAGTGAEEDAPSITGDELQGLHILVTEDNMFSAEMLTERLDLEGATYEHASNGQIAVDVFEQSEPGHFDLVLMDVEMPVMGGYDATRAIRASEHPDAATMPIFAMTANVFSEDVQRAIDAGMNIHLAKPVDFDKLKQAVREYVKDRSARP